MLDLLNVAQDSMTILAAHIPMVDLPDSDPVAPPGLADMWNRVVGVGKWIALGIAILGLFIIGGKMAYDSRRGETTEEVGSLIKLVMAVTLISGGASLIGFIVG
ncbi:hypothetical protein [Kocuria sp.]|uniref:hypothetical protein n=1 Tax=Kocuria sp. TaxID=1871328 RepID=UPI0028AD0C3A|nr:hypothetical protein [Kocuria sp.]